MEKKRHGKSIAREKAIKSLYTFSINDTEENIYSRDKMANEIVKSVVGNKDVIDELIKKNLKRWTITEINKVDLSILRVSINEILFEETPKPIIVNEALEFAKIYSDENAKKFIHGVLDKIIKEKNGE